MSEEPKPSYSAREIVLEFFPATPDRLVPGPLRYRLARADDGNVLVLDPRGHEALRLVPLAPSGNRTTQLCCDLCRRTGTRDFLQVLRAVVPGSAGRRFRYITACRNIEGCEGRRRDDAPVVALLTGSP